ncbi:MAG TPA: hypothetical protein VFI11_15175 [Anaerolineales bacterium]|nr:hypothetical protein [Anaerolineales bacterium]
MHPFFDVYLGGPLTMLIAVAIRFPDGGQAGPVGMKRSLLRGVGAKHRRWSVEVRI